MIVVHNNEVNLAIMRKFPSAMVVEENIEYIGIEMYPDDDEDEEEMEQELLEAYHDRNIKTFEPKVFGE